LRQSIAGGASILIDLRLSPIRSFKSCQDRAVTQWAAVGGALIRELTERFPHDLHRSNLRLKLQGPFEG
jgi:hypothetical protein